MELIDSVNRRDFQVRCGLGLSGLALRSLVSEADVTDRSAPHFAPRAKSVILLFMSGGPSQVDTFDPKPELRRLAGKDVPESIATAVPRIQRAGLRNLMPSPWKFVRHGESGLSISELFPQLARYADDLCLIRSMAHRNPVHGPGECVALTGTADGQRPSLGAWTLYGLGKSSRNLPDFIAMNLRTTGMQFPQNAGWSAGFLPSRFQGTVVAPQRGIPHATLPEGTSQEKRTRELETIQLLNRRFQSRIQGLSDLEARVQSYEMAFQMQTAAPELFAIQQETAAEQQKYGMMREQTREAGRACLLARRMVERGVRFVQLRIGGWDAHGNIARNHTDMAQCTDQPIAALLSDLKRRGLLETTLVVWGGEFGRTPTMEGRGRGRDHSPAAYSTWLAGGGVRGGTVIGATDPIGYTPIERPVGPADLHATILHALGLDSDRLVFNHHGLRETPLGTTDGDVISEVFS